MQELLTQTDADLERWDVPDVLEDASQPDVIELESVQDDGPAVADFAEAEPHLVVDETLAVAAWHARKVTVARKRASREYLAAFCLSLLAHLVLVGLCLAMAFAIRVLLPGVLFSQGQGSIDVGLVSDTESDGAPQAASLPGPAITAPPASKSLPLQDTSTDRDLTPDSVPNPANHLGSFPSPETESNPVIVGIAPAAGGAPRWNPQFPKVNAPPAQVKEGSPTPAPPAQTPAAAVRHVLVHPRALGHGGTAWGDAGSGFDSRGLPVPEYPPESKRRHEQGTVYVEAVVNADGSVGRVRISQPSGFPRLDAAALDATRRAVLSPATDNGTPVPLAIVIPFRFTLR
ncbi:MAG TPA: TonB family protein [Tepidisphaeraceae bacterium]|nr:TonB family protein [Tepidisphaeraceae bacterium]